MTLNPLIDLGPKLLGHEEVTPNDCSCGEHFDLSTGLIDHLYPDEEGVAEIS